MADIRYTVTIDASTGAAEIKKLEGEFDKLAGTTKKTGVESEKAGSQFGKLVATFVASIATIESVRKLWSNFSGNIKEAAKAAIEQENVDMALRSSLAITGREVNLNARHFQDYAQQIQKTTLFTDDQVESAQTLLLQLTKLDRDGLDQATRGSIGLASALGVDLQSAAMMVVKAMEGNYAALSRYGIRVDENLSATEKQSSLLNKLEMMYRRATDAANAFGGSLIQLKKSFNELSETQGSYFTQSEYGKEVLIRAREGVDALNERLKTGHATFRDWIAQSRIAVTPLGDLAKLAIAANLAIDGLDWTVKRNTKSFGEVTDKWKDADQALIDLATDALKAKKAVSAFGDKYNFAPLIREFKLIDDVAEPVWKDLGLVPVLIANASGKVGTLGGTYSAAFKGMQTETGAFREKFLSMFNQIAGSAASLFGGLASLSRANTEKRLDDLDQYYEAQKQQVADSLMTEQQKADALKVLDEKHEIARKNLARSAAKDEKSYSVFQAIISTAAAVINAMTAKPFGPWNFIQAALVAAMGAVQIATINKQPIPLAGGFEGMVRQPTLFLAGEAGPERLSVRPGEGGGGQAIRISLAVPIYIAGHKFEDKLIEIIGRISTSGRLKIAAKAIA